MKPCVCVFALTAVALGQVPHQHHPPSLTPVAKASLMSSKTPASGALLLPLRAAE